MRVRIADYWFPVVGFSRGRGWTSIISDFRAEAATIKASALILHFLQRLCPFFSFGKGWSVAGQFLCILSGMQEGLRYLLWASDCR